MHGNNFPLRLPSEALGVRRSDVFFRRTARHFNCIECIELRAGAVSQYGSSAYHKDSAITCPIEWENYELRD